ncbi:hypothetical protein [Bradyrhizobium sp. CB1015]|uniref:hypothetical protein n=1 Tax=Bradyrhizobium sp. CB1015 TaxID=2976822 RepID=UPI0021AA6D5A|nr:hypothetical protein [Bradyrhizobium sp. CB1015]UWU89767.1 hypothetical protein N2604_25130 [Bradyrhizobium sp. CB1015]
MISYSESEARDAEKNADEQPKPPNYREMFECHRAEKKRAKNRSRQARHRARPKETSVAKLAAALRKATAKPRGPHTKLLEQLRDRVKELAGFRYLSRMLIAQHGAMSDADLGRHLCITRKKAWQTRQIVADLESEGGPWHNI